ncbi:hypothetical protein M3Y97_00668400 [Aphelenchoides bicaudatus]|nr:hypothetical protein M3Y97_00668400 [Aphelenchoides bicaudatus]
MAIIMAAGNNYVALVQFFFSFFVSIFVLISLSILLYKNQRHTEKVIMPPVIINISAWAVAAFFDIGYTTSSIVAWFTGGEFTTEIHTEFIYWTGALYFSATTAVSMSVFFITLDRCLIFTPSLFMDERLKHRLYIANLIAVVGDFFFFLGVFIVFERPDFALTKCQTFSCVTNFHALTLNVARMFFGSVNVITATVFAILFYRYNKQREVRLNKANGNKLQLFNGHARLQPQEQQINTSSRGNKIAWIAVFAELTFNFLPNLVSYLAQAVFDFVLSSDAGPVVSTFSQLDALLTTIVYLKIIWRRVIQQKVSDTKTNTYI